MRKWFNEMIALTPASAVSAAFTLSVCNEDSVPHVLMLRENSDRRLVIPAHLSVEHRGSFYYADLALKDEDWVQGWNGDKFVIQNGVLKRLN